MPQSISVPRRLAVPVLLVALLAGWLTPTAAEAVAPGRTAAETIAEARLFERHNVARTAPGTYGQSSTAPAPALRWAEDVAVVARQWADTMAATGTFTPNPGLAGQVCCAITVAENVAHVEGIPNKYTLEAAADRVVELAMASRAHRDRLMDPAFTQVGLGAAIDTSGKLWVSMVYRQPTADAPSASPSYPHPVPSSPGPLPPPGDGDGPEPDPGPSPDPDNGASPAPGQGGTQPPSDGGGLGPVSPPVRPIDSACPPSIPRANFVDVTRPEPVRAVSCLVWWGVAQGTSATTFSPTREVRRDQMASFVARAIEQSGGTLPTPSRHHFRDVNPDSVHAEAINKLAEAGILGGRADGRFQPEVAISRGQMTQTLVLAYERRTGQSMPGPTYRWFSDVRGHSFERTINQAADAGWAGGFVDGTFRPNEGVRRDQMAIFLTRWLANLIDDGLATRPR